MDSGDFTSSVVVVDLTNQAYSESSSVTTHSSAVKRLDCNTKRLHMFTSDKWALKVLHYRLFPPHTIRHLPIRPSCSTWEFFFFILLVAAFFLHVIFFPYPHISNLFVIFFLNAQQLALLLCGSTWLCCPITDVTSIHLLPQHSRALMATAALLIGARIKKKPVFFLCKFAFQFICKLLTKTALSVSGYVMYVLVTRRGSLLHTESHTFKH